VSYVLIVINHGTDKENKMEIHTSKYNGIETFNTLIELANSISKVMPSILFKPASYQKYGVPENQYPNGVCRGMQVFYKSDTNAYIGTIMIEGNWNEPKYEITSINITDGRNSYGIDGQYKQSIHAKNIVRIAKKVFKPFTFDQIANRANRKFRQEVDAIGSKIGWEIRGATCNEYELFKDDLENLYHLDYKPKSDKFKQVMEYIVANKEKIDKYHNYDPPHYFVLIASDKVQYRLCDQSKSEPFTVANKDALPDDIKGKMFVLDITDQQTFVEEIGLKENDGAYWVLA
jgi:hypothetical protein